MKILTEKVAEIVLTLPSQSPFAWPKLPLMTNGVIQNPEVVVVTLMNSKLHDKVVVAEGEEPEEYWPFLSGKAEYPKERDLGDAEREARLFQCTCNSSAARVWYE